MIYTAYVLKTGRGSGRSIYVASDGVRGIIQSPVPYKAVARTNRQDKYVVSVGGQRIRGYELIEVDNLAYLEKSKRDLTKLWSLDEQFAYFLDRETYERLFQPINFKPKVLFFDLEIGTSGGEPNYERDPIVMIGYGTLDSEEVTVIHSDDERDILKRFLEVIAEEDPDIYCGYFSKAFDVPYLKNRLRIHGLDVPSSSVRIKADKIATATQQWDIFLGRCHYDVYGSVLLDTSLTGKVKSRSLKEIARYYGSPYTVKDLPSSVKTNILDFIRKDKATLMEYLESDVKQTKFLFSVYYPLYASFADEAMVPFDSIVNAAGRSPYPKFVLGRCMVDSGYYPFIKNRDRNRTLYNYTRNGRFRGAFTGIRATGRFKDVFKVDFTSMYPSIMVTFNLSPETVSFVSAMSLDLSLPDSDLWIDRGVRSDGYYPILVDDLGDNRIQVSIPDDAIKKYLSFVIDRNKSGVISEKVLWLLESRASIRNKMKSLDPKSPEYLALDGLQNSRKIAANSMFGIFGNEHFEVGDLSVAMLVTAFGREISHFVCNLISEQGCQVIEIDTDGIYASGKIDLKKLNEDLHKAIREKYTVFPKGIRLTLSIEKEGIRGLFLKMKNYALYDDRKDTLTVMGSSMKGSSKPKVIEHLINRAARDLLMWKSPAVVYEETLQALDNYALWKETDFVMYQRITKSFDEYQSDGGFTNFLNMLYNSSASEAVDLNDGTPIYETIERIASYARSLAAHSGLTNVEEIYKSIKETLMTVARETQDYETIISIAELQFQYHLGKQGKRPMSQPVKLLAKAMQENKLQLVEGSIPYYYALGTDDGLEIYSEGITQQKPPDMKRYRRMLSRVIREMTSACITKTSTEEVGTLW